MSESSNTGRRVARQLILATYLLLWPPLLILGSRTSSDAAVFGMWSVRAFVLLIAMSGAVVFASIVVVSVVLSDARFQRLVDSLEALKRRKVRYLAVVSLPLLTWVCVFTMAAIIGVSPRLAVVVGMTDATLLVVLLGASLKSLVDLTEQSPPSRRDKAANVTLFSTATVFLTGVGLLISDSAAALRYGHIPTILLLLLVIVWLCFLLCSPVMASKSTCRKLAVLAVSITLSLAVLESGLRLLGPPSMLEKQRRLATAEGHEFDSRTALQVLLDRRRKGEKIFPSGSFETYLHEIHWSEFRFFSGDSANKPVIRVDGEVVLPLGHLANSLILDTGNENGYYETFHTDAHGFRNPPGLWDGKPIDVVGVGDSFTEGCHVRFDESFMSNIRKTYPRTVNLGLGGGGPFPILAAIREYCHKLKPKVVLWFFYEGNDLDDFLRRQHVPLLRRYLDRDFNQRLIRRQSKIDEALKQYFEKSVAEKRSKSDHRWQPTYRQLTENLVSMLTCRRTRQMLGIDPRRSSRGTSLFAGTTNPYWSQSVLQMNGDDWLLLERILLRAKTEVEGWGGKLYFVYLPDYHRCAASHFKEHILAPTKAQRQADPRYRILDITADLKIEVIDITRAIAQHSDPMSLYPFRSYGHFNRKGYEFVARHVTSRLSQDAESPLRELRK